MKRILTEERGIPVIYDPEDTSGLFAAGIVFFSGSAHEPAELSGISHLIEHMVFKGSDRFDAKTIARLSESVGGMLNAYTSKEQTVIYVMGVVDAAETLIDMLFDVAFNPKFPSHEIDREKDVIANEIMSIQDDPSERLAEAVDERLYPSSGLGRPVAGTIETVDAISRGSIIDWHVKRFSPNRCLVSVSGNIDPDIIDRAMSRAGVSVTGEGAVIEPVAAAAADFDDTVRAHVEQAYASLVIPAFSASHPDRHALTALTMITGSLMSSRLFETVREKLGLCYAIDMDATLLLAAGHAEVYYECAPKSIDRVEDAVRAELDALAAIGIEDRELDTAIAQMLFNVRQAYTGVEPRMGANARQFAIHGRLLATEEIESNIRAVSVDDVSRLARDMYSEGYSRCRLLPLKS